MSDSNLLNPLGSGMPLPGGNIRTPPRPRGGVSGGPPVGAGSAMLRGPTMPQMQALAAQPAATIATSAGQRGSRVSVRVIDVGRGWKFSTVRVRAQKVRLAAGVTSSSLFHLLRFKKGKWPQAQ